MTLSVSPNCGGEDILGRIFLGGKRPYLWIIAAIAVLYAKSVSFGYTFLDDNILVFADQGFLKDMANVIPAFFRKVFPGSYLPYYRPMLTVSLMLDAQVSGASLWFYHITNIAWHAAASCLVMALLLRLGYDKLPSFLLGMIFAVHPVLSQGAAWIPGRNDTMMAFFVLASFISLLMMLGTKKAPYYALHLVFFLSAIFTKETALVLIPVSVLYLYLVEKERLFSRAIFVLAAGWAACAAAWYCFRHAAVQGSMDLTIAEAARLVTMYLPAAVQFTGKIFFPFNLSVFPIIQDTAFVYGIAASAALIIALILTKEKRYGYILFGLAWAVLFILPSLVRANYRISADFLEHRTYLPVMGFFILLLETDLLKKARRPALVSAAAIIVLAYGTISFIHMDNFRDRLAFWRNAVKTSPHSPFAHLAMAQAYHAEGRPGDAEAQFRKCLELEPLQYGAFFGLGEIRLARGDLKEAEALFRKSIAAYPFFDGAYLELGVAYYKQGRFRDAERAWGRVIMMDPGNIAAHKFLAISYKERGDYDKAGDYARRLRRMGVQPPAEFMKSVGAE